MLFVPPSPTWPCKCRVAQRTRCCRSPPTSRGRRRTDQSVHFSGKQETTMSIPSTSSVNRHTVKPDCFLKIYCLCSRYVNYLWRMWCMCYTACLECLRTWNQINVSVCNRTGALVFVSFSVCTHWSLVLMVWSRCLVHHLHKLQSGKSPSFLAASHRETPPYGQSHSEFWE